MTILRQVVMGSSSGLENQFIISASLDSHCGSLLLSPIFTDRMTTL